jgi:hypothetical protein
VVTARLLVEPGGDPRYRGPTWPRGGSCNRHRSGRTC